MSSSEPDQYAENLKNTIWKTKGSRFNAARRLNNKYYFSVFGISILSVYGAAISIIQGIQGSLQCPKLNSLYNAISLILSIFTLTLSLLEGAKNHQVRAERLHNNALELSRLQRELEYSITFESQDSDFGQKLRDLSLKYEKLIKRCPENHELEDYILFTAKHQNNHLNEFFIRIKLIFVDYWLYGFILGVPLILISLYSSC